MLLYVLHILVKIDFLVLQLLHCEAMLTALIFSPKSILEGF